MNKYVDYVSQFCVILYNKQFTQRVSNQLVKMAPHKHVVALQLQEKLEVIKF